MTAVFYEQEKLWGNAPEPYQPQLRADILSILPPDAHSILDVGCGDGFVTDALPGELRVVGLDISVEALRHVHRPAVLGSAVDLPFADGAFELVMATDVIEHIPAGDYERCLAELARVSSRYVLLAVPHGEQLEANLARCGGCGCIYHVNRHQRSFHEATMRDLPVPGLRLLELRFSGSDTRPPWDPLVELAHRLGQYHVWQGGQCPDCGSAAQTSVGQSLLAKALDSCRATLWAQRVQQGPAWNNRSELLALYENRVPGSGFRVPEMQPRNPEPGTRNPSLLCESRGSPLDIDFSNALQAASAGFVGGSGWARFVCPEGAAISEAGVGRRAEGPAGVAVQIRIPVWPRPGDRIVLRASGAGADDGLSLVGIDGVSEIRREVLNRTVTAAGEALEAMVDWLPGPCGLALEAQLRGGVALQQLQYISASAGSARFIQLREGHNVLSLPGREGYVASWGFLAEATGLYPAPECPAVEERPAEIAENDLLRLLAERMDQAVLSLARQQASLVGQLEAKERQRDAAEQAYAQAQGGQKDLAGLLSQLNELLEAKERQRAEAESAYARAEAAHAQVEAAYGRMEAMHARVESAYGEAQARLAEVVREKESLAKTLESREAARAKIEQALADAKARCELLETSLAQTEASRHAAEIAYAQQGREHQSTLQDLERTREELQRRSGIKGAVWELLRSGKRRLVGPRLERLREVYPRPWRPLAKAPDLGPGAPRVLVLSHLFPHPDQPCFGPFVLEQVRALRRYAGVDARVLSGRPFWMQSIRRNPVLFLRQNHQYWDFHRSCQWQELEEVPVMYLPYRVMLGFWFHGWSYTRAMCRNIDAIHRQFPFELVHAHTGYTDGSAGAAIARRFNVPLIVTEHTGPFSGLMADWRVRRQTLRSLEQARRIIAVSSAQKADVARHVSAAAQERILVIHNGVALRDFHPPAQWRPSSRAPRLLFVGGLDEVKNVSLLLTAFAQVLKAAAEATLTIIGTGSQSALLSEQAACLQIDRQVTFAGRLDRADVARAMREECDILVLSSTSETFGCVLVEAMASGKPVVATRCGGPEDIVTEPMLGCLCRNGDAEDLARALLDVIGRLDTFPSDRIRQHAEQRFGYPAIAGRIAEVYKEVLSR
jgi:glycosyltransferase involved in cell wall biosynthesis/SAM-dependent methyltransferase